MITCLLFSEVEMRLPYVIIDKFVVEFFPLKTSAFCTVGTGLPYLQLIVAR